jgi:hypothetical protein
MVRREGLHVLNGDIVGGEAASSMDLLRHGETVHEGSFPQLASILIDPEGAIMPGPAGLGE